MIFLNLTKNFINGNYGELILPDEEVQALEERPLRWYEIFGKWVERMIGLGLPAAGLYLLIVRPAFFSSFPVSPNTLMTVLLAWLALSIDSVLGVGLTAIVITTAREFRNLV